jgi:hypothetical protein
MRHWVVEPIPARQGMPALPGQIRVSSPCPLLELQPMDCANLFLGCR